MESDRRANECAERLQRKTAFAQEFERESFSPWEELVRSQQEAELRTCSYRALEAKWEAREGRLVEQLAELKEQLWRSRSGDPQARRAATPQSHSASASDHPTTGGGMVTSKPSEGGTSSQIEPLLDSKSACKATAVPEVEDPSGTTEREMVRQDTQGDSAAA